MSANISILKHNIVHTHFEVVVVVVVFETCFIFSELLIMSAAHVWHHRVCFATFVSGQTST